mgnify:CR=1 FL=1
MDRREELHKLSEHELDIYNRYAEQQFENALKRLNVKV